MYTPSNGVSSGYVDKGRIVCAPGRVSGSKRVQCPSLGPPELVLEFIDHPPPTLIAVCDGSIISSIENIQAMKGCVIIKGDLIIDIPGAG